MRNVMFIVLMVITVASLMGGWIPPNKGNPPGTFETIDLAVIKRYESLFSSAEIAFRKGNYLSLKNGVGYATDILVPGTILVYQTDQGNLGKMKITGYAIDYARTELGYSAFCDVPVFLFTTYRTDGSILISGSKPHVLEEGAKFSHCCTLKGVEDPDRVSLLETLDLGSWDYTERPEEGSFMWFHFDFDTNETSINPNKFPDDFKGADLYNIKTERYSRFSPKNGARFLVVYQP